MTLTWSTTPPDCFDVAPQREWAGPILEPQEAALMAAEGV